MLDTDHHPLLITGNSTHSSPHPSLTSSSSRPSPPTSAYTKASIFGKSLNIGRHFLHHEIQLGMKWDKIQAHAADESLFTSESVIQDLQYVEHVFNLASVGLGVGFHKGPMEDGLEDAW